MLSERYLQLRQKNIKDMHNSELLRACKEDNLLLEEFLKENKDFIFSIIIKYKGSLDSLARKFKVDEEEILQHAFIGVLSALRDFDFDRGFKFTTYVVRPILWEINQLLYNDSQLVRLSRGAVDLLKRMKEVEDSLGYLPTIEETAQILKVSEGRIREIIRFTKDFERIDGIDDYGVVHEEQECESDIVDKIYVEQLLNDAELTPEETEIVSLIMNEGLNNSQIADRLGKYPMTVNRAILRIKEKLQNSGEVDKKSKYDAEIDLAASEMDELGYVIPIDDLQDLFEVCGLTDIPYSPRILYYIRQKALSKVTRQLDSTREELS